MNKIYKIIWSKVKNCYVVVSEITKNNRKGTTIKGSKAGAVLAALLLIHGAFSLPAEAAGEVVWAPSGSTATGATDGHMVHGTGAMAGDSLPTSKNSLAWGTGAKVTGDHSLAFGENSKVDGHPLGHNIAIGAKAEVSD